MYNHDPEGLLSLGDYKRKLANNEKKGRVEDSPRNVQFVSNEKLSEQDGASIKNISPNIWDF